MRNYTDDNEMFYKLYHANYPDNITYLKNFIVREFNAYHENLHYKAMLHFLDRLSENEHVFIYGMLCDAWNQFNLSIQ